MTKQDFKNYFEEYYRIQLDVLHDSRIAEVILYFESKVGGFLVQESEIEFETKNGCWFADIDNYWNNI